MPPLDSARTLMVAEISDCADQSSGTPDRYAIKATAELAAVIGGSRIRRLGAV